MHISSNKYIKTVKETASERANRSKNRIIKNRQKSPIIKFNLLPNCIFSGLDGDIIRSEKEWSGVGNYHKISFSLLHSIHSLIAANEQTEMVFVVVHLKNSDHFQFSVVAKKRANNLIS